MTLRLISIWLLTLLISSSSIYAQHEKTETSPLDDLAISSLKFRSVGPALTSGRISDIAVHPQRHHEYYVATSSGGVWKTDNAGTTFKPLFDGEGSYSIGCITMDPSDPNVLWVGTGENNNQRSVAYGDGIYKSTDGGASWKNMGLENSEHIGKIIVHPDDPNIIWVAAIGPLWNKGGDRGVYKSTDGGANWKAVLTVDDYTGATDLIIDPRNPDILYAAMLQRGRRVWTYLGGGPGSGLYKSTDGGVTWAVAQRGLPSVELGRIGLAVSPADPEYLYAIVEAAQGKSGTYRSTNRGASWEKMGGYVTSGNYYQEIVADPIDRNTLYSMNTWMQVSHDGGRSWTGVGENTKHVDNHCMWIDPQDTDHWIVGCDGGIYETWDAATSWKFFDNLPVTQFYKVVTDDDTPFYNIYGGTQDNFSMGGPSRTSHGHGIKNSDWYITHGGDGFESAIDPDNPDIVYAQSQYGVLVRYDRKSGEELGIQPKERKGENAYRWNWDAPLVCSHHVPKRIYFAANKVFRSDDRGQSWEVISDDLTRQLDRNSLAIHDHVWSIDAVTKNRSTSPYGTIVAFSESPLRKDLLVVGTDDGLIQITEDGGSNWRQIDNIPGAPKQSYINAVYCSQHDPNRIYAVFNHHKSGDFKPYIFRSDDTGRSWRKISDGLPPRGSVYAIVEDHEREYLLFCGTEFGVHFTPDGGSHWKALKAGLPTVAVRDIDIQQRENDLVLGTFGRGFYVLDDYSPLRDISAQGVDGVARLFTPRAAWSYEEATPLGIRGAAFQGDNFYMGENLGPVAIIDYYYGEEHKSLQDARREKEKEDRKAKRDIGYPDYETLKAEKEDRDPLLLFTIKNSDGDIVRKITRPLSKGLSRLKWDMRYASKEPVSLSGPSFYNPFSDIPVGTRVPPGEYTISMELWKAGQLSSLAEPVTLTVKPLKNRVLPATDHLAMVAFQREVAELDRSIGAAHHLLTELSDRMKYIKKAIDLVEAPSDALWTDYYTIEDNLKALRTSLDGDRVKTQLDIDQPPSPATRIGWINYEQKYSSSTPTQTHRMSLDIAREEFIPILSALQSIATDALPALEKRLEEADAPYTPGRAIRMMIGN